MHKRISDRMRTFYVFPDGETRVVRHVSGGAEDPDVDQLIEQLRSDATAVSAEDIEGAQARLDAAAEEAGAEKNLERLEAIAEAAEALRTEVDRRETAAAEEERKTQELLARVKGDEPAAEGDPEAGDGDEGDGDGDGEEGDGDGGDTESGSEETPAETTTTTETTTETETTTPQAEGAEEPEAIAAAGTKPTRKPTPPRKRVSPGAMSRSRSGSTSPKSRQTEEKQFATIVAAGDLHGFSAGDKVTDEEKFMQLGEAASRKAEAILRMGQAGKPMSAMIASVQWDYPDDRFLGDDAGLNGDKIQAVVASLQNDLSDADAIVAAGGLCAPVEVVYDVPTIGSRRRPIRDALARFGATRGGIRYPVAPRLTDLDDATTLWTEANDTTPGSDGPATKPCLRVDCGTWEEQVIDALYFCLEIGNFERRTFAENFAAWWELGQVNLDRVAENRLWDRMAADSTAVTVAEALGTTRDVIAGVARLGAAFRSRHRTAPDFTLQAFLPEWLVENIAVDLLRQPVGEDRMAVVRADIERWLAARNVQVVWSPDAGGQIFGAQADGGVLPWPTQVEAIIAPPGSHLYLDGGRLEFGMEIRAPELNETNDVQAAFEIFENTAFRGIESFVATFNICPSGKTAAPDADYDPCVVGS